MNQSKYPTKEEILAEPYEPSEETYSVVRKWKAAYFDGKWKDAGEENKYNQLHELIAAICVSLNEPQPHWTGNIDHWYYDPLEKTISADINKLSIISALHELGHHILGDSELEACRFSIGIFMKCFPNTYKKLVWDGHMLKKPYEEPRENSSSAR